MVIKSTSRIFDFVPFGGVRILKKALEAITLFDTFDGNLNLRQAQIAFINVGVKVET